MARSSWDVELQESGNNYVADGSIYVVNKDFPISVTSNLQKVTLADGDVATILSEVKETDDDLSFDWINISTTDALIAKIETYITNGSVVRITDHLSNTFTGSFISLVKTPLVGQADVLNLSATFMQF